MGVHPPEHGIHSWRDFFVHMGTICLGLLIAIGLEQTVEWVHHRRERTELREAMNRDLEQTLSASETTYETTRQSSDWLGERITAPKPLWKSIPLSQPGRCRSAAVQSPALAILRSAQPRRAAC